MKRVVKVAFSFAWYAAHRTWEVLNAGSGNRSRLTILYYHAVRAEDRSAFRWQIEAIKSYADVVGPDYTGEPTGRPMIAITFDDAFTSVVDNALPELAARGMNCTIFVPTGCLGSPPHWLIGSTYADRDQVIADRETLRAVVSKNVRLGSHSRSHPNLREIGPAEAQEEISGSKADIESFFGSATDLFAFPYGLFEQQTLRLCETAGYRFVYSIEVGSIDPRDVTMLRPRIVVEPTDTKLEFWLKIRGGYNWLRYASALKRKFLQAASQRAIPVGP
jgi:peptidoglycan/xylan/chitin deacetylase (PgdA/CDA1 family)